MGTPPTGRRDGGSGTAVGGDLHLLLPEHGCAVCYNQAHYGPMYGGGADIGTKGYQEVVVIVQVRCGGDADSGLGGGMDRGGRGDRRDGDRYIISPW